MSHLRRLGVLTALVVCVLGLTGATASAAPADWSGSADLPPNPRDPGNGTRAGKDIEINYHPDSIGVAQVKFHAWDEKLERKNLTSWFDGFARITYYSRNGTKYEWNVDVPPNASTPVQLGSDDDLLEGGDIYIKLCIDGTTDCSGQYHGIT